MRNKYTNKISMMKIALACAVLFGSGNLSTQSYAADVSTVSQLLNSQYYTNSSTLKLLNNLTLSNSTFPELNGSQYSATLFGNGYSINGSVSNSNDSTFGYSLKNGASLTFDNVNFDSINFTKGDITSRGAGNTNYSILGLIVNNTANFYIKNNSQFNNAGISLNSGVAWGFNSNVTI